MQKRPQMKQRKAQKDIADSPHQMSNDFYDYMVETNKEEMADETEEVTEDG